MKYIDAEKIIAEIERLEKVDYPCDTYEQSVGFYDALDRIKYFINSLQQEQPMPNSTQLIELWHADKEILKEKDFRDDPRRLAYNAFMYGFGRGLAVKQQEQPEKSKKDCNNCPHCVDRKDQYGWHFKGCFGGPYKGKFIAEIDECPLKQEQSEINLEEEVKKYFQGYWPGTKTPEQCNTDMHFTPLAITRMVKHFYELGKNARKV